MSAKAFVDGLLQSHKVVVFSKTYCPYCHKAKSIFDNSSLKAGSLEWIEIDERKDCNEIQDYLGKLTGARSVPRVFIGGQFIGGCDDTVAAHKNGKLAKLLAEAGAV
ncbi:unnamed protein product [Caenorhabditis angaria]|uniref:Glutaredoxin-1 n=1 Tax=Caenorhabditis angaria TaxID=860376 RepID=A0A9P1MVZ0_9PELO|nr:unnamed protein product [Caenorhabditis angaria]